MPLRLRQPISASLIVNPAWRKWGDVTVRKPAQAAYAERT
jgi:hypothetical protein